MLLMFLFWQLAQMTEDGAEKEVATVPSNVAPCTLDKPTQSLIKLIFDIDMFKEAMANFEIGKYVSPIFHQSQKQSA